ncbi:sensor histidine kinase [Sphingomonas morindae]|uniref:histidine kinase n=1 Tax=Sphingomonas morindae TaxID=1541170 RepID=A0ABY4X4A6_9SPHN|nr:sensor histidine kinase [Sphingomonas morindae]USI71690.1 sensor histidine kinase [Sphingomonas morindae]
MSGGRANALLERFLAWSLDHPLPAPLAIAAATLVITLAALIRLWFITNLLPWLVFIPPVLGIALATGWAVGAYAVLLAALLAAISIAGPASFPWLSRPQWAASLLFIAIGLGVARLAAALREAYRRSRADSVARGEMVALLTAREGQLELLNRELSHRLKNQLTLAQAIASQTLRQAEDLRGAGEALMVRLAALGRATDVLIAGEWSAAALHAVAQAALGHHEALAGRVRMQGPPLTVTAEVALALTLTLHELVTNATKYGALSTESGLVSLEWGLISSPDAPDSARFHLRWKEEGGPPVQPPARRGFGSVMIERSLRAYLQGDTAIAYDRDGLCFTIDAPAAGTVVQSEAD